MVRCRLVLLQKLGRHIERFGSHFLGGDRRRVGSHHCGARRMRTDAVFNAIRAAMHHPDPAIVDAKRLGADLGDHRFEPLPHGSSARYYLDLAVGMDINARAVGRPQPALFDVHGQAKADIFSGPASSHHIALELVPFASRNRLV